MKKFLLILTGVLLLTLLSGSRLYSQDNWWKNKKFKDAKTQIKFDECKKTFKEIAAGLNFNNISSITRYFDEQVYLNLISFEKGYYSRNQAESILSDFMDYFKVVSFKYTRSYYKNSFAFAIGNFKYDIGSGVRILQGSVSLLFNDYSWIIDQIAIN